MDSNKNITNFDIDSPVFEDRSNSNGMTYWLASDLAEMLGYVGLSTFKKVMNKAQSVCLTLDIPVSEHFIQYSVEDKDGKTKNSIKLSRFACYLAVMNSDVKKPEVAKAQVYFATFAESCRQYVEEAEAHQRVLVRDEISQHESSLSSTVKNAGISNYAFFQNAGYLGMYNMNISKLKTVKGIPSNRTPLDFMGSSELAANLFRITQTEEKIKKEGIKGQRGLEKTAKSVGQKVRSTMKEISGTVPEALPTAQDIKKVKTGIKHTARGLGKIDKS